MKYKILWLEPTPETIVHIAGELEKQGHFVDRVDTVTLAESRLRQREAKVYDFIFIDSEIAITPEELNAYPPFFTRDEYRTGLAFYQRVKAFLETIGTRPIVITGLYGQDVKDDFLENGLPEEAFFRKKNPDLAVEILEEMGKMTKESKKKDDNSRADKSINISGHFVSNVQVQQDSDHSSQAMDAIGGNIFEGVSNYVKELRENIDALEIQKEQEEKMEELLKNLEIEVKSETPKPNIVKEALLSLRSILEKAAGGVLASTFISQIPDLILGLQALIAG